MSELLSDEDHVSLDLKRGVETISTNSSAALSLTDLPVGAVWSYRRAELEAGGDGDFAERLYPKEVRARNHTCTY